MVIKRRVRRVYKSLPPHTNEAFPLTNEGEARKALIIGIIAIVAVIGLSLLLLFSDTFVGKAIQLKGVSYPNCGNSVLDIGAGEKCDDGNKFNSDGCSLACQIESGWTCTAPTTRTAVSPKAKDKFVSLKVPSKCTKQEVKLCVNPPSGLVRWWPGESSITGGQEWVGGYETNFLGDVTFSPGKVGQALKFDGVDDFLKSVDIPNDPSTSTPAAFTISAWVNLNNKGGSIITKSHFNAEDWGLQVVDYFLKLSAGKSVLSNDRIDISSQSKVINTGQWHHVVVIYDAPANVAKMYVDGKEVPTTILVNNQEVANPKLSVLKDTEGPLFIGASMYKGKLTSFFNGMMDELSFWNRALTPVEIKSIYDAGSAGMCKPVVPTCNDGKKNGYETDLDCGGSCTKCVDNKACLKNNDCLSDYCDDNSVCKPVQQQQQQLEQPVCGNGNLNLDAGEQCDDGNILDGDGCSSTCNTELPPEPVPVQDTDSDGMDDNLDLCKGKGEKGLIHGKGAALGCYYGDEDKSGCVSTLEYTVFKAKYKKDFEGIQSELSAGDYTIYKAKYKKGLICSS